MAANEVVAETRTQFVHAGIDLAKVSSPTIDRPIFAGTIRVHTIDTAGNTFESSPYVEARRGTGEYTGAVHFDVTPDKEHPQHSIMGALYSAMRGQIAKALLASGVLLGAGGAEAQGGFLVNSADIPASRALGESYTGLPTNDGTSGLVGLRFEDPSGRMGSATYINPYYLITAGHVTWGFGTWPIGVTIGSNVATDSIATYLESITYFPTYEGPNGEFFTPDLAILKLRDPLATDYIQEIGEIPYLKKIVGVGFGQVGAADLGDYRERTGEASGWYGRAAFYGGGGIHQTYTITTLSCPQQ